MINPAFPNSWKNESKPHKFCPGCGQALALKALGYAIDELDLAKKMVYGCDIGCSLLTWDMFNVDTIQTHHGRVIPTIVGFKLARPDSVSVAFLGDGGGYAIGAQHLVNAAMRNDKITVILINNANYAMTGGQLAPTTMVGQVTDTTPDGRKEEMFGNPLHGPEMIAKIAAPGAYIARTTSNNMDDCKAKIKKALQNQIDGNGFSFVEILSMCPVNWKTNTQESLDFIDKKMVNVFPLGEISQEGMTNNQITNH
ncbi:MAG: thiamine pyrophosphate-dependent enzyme [Candidatus Berkelbacteria bacterium]